MEQKTLKQALNLLSGFNPELTINKDLVKILEYGSFQGEIVFILVSYGNCEIKLTRTTNVLGVCWQYEML